MSAVAPARQAAFRILLAVERGSSHSDDLLRAKAVTALSPADRNLATALVLGVLRWQIWLDQELRPLLRHPNARLDPEALIALRLGAFQLLFLDRIPAHAAIDESVELAKRAGQAYAARMVNAVLRRLSRSDFLKEGIAGSAAVRAHPEWLVKRWVNFYGPEAAPAICRHGQNQPTLTLRLESPAAEDELARAGIELAPGDLLTAARTAVSGDVAATAAFREGRIRFQDEGSQLIAEIAACAGENLNQKVKSIPKAKRILDTCAAPGGKTLILAQRHPRARIVACESSAQRLAELRRRLAAYTDRAEHVECRLADATALEEDSTFDLALADVPCSGTGTLGRNPEIRHRLRPEDLPRHVARQRQILRAALRSLRPGGRAVYSTCSLEPEENEQVIAAVLAETPGVRQLSLACSIDSLRSQGILTASGAERLLACLTPAGALRLLPGAFRTDGFFVALLERTAGEPANPAPGS